MSDTMRLEAKGPVVPAPILRGPLQSISATIQSWPGVIAATHWHLSRREDVDGADFYVGEHELGHLHLDGEAHIATDATLRRALLAQGLARPFPYYASWVESTVSTARDAEHAIWLFRLNYDRLCGVGIDDLVQRIGERGR